MEGVYKLSSTEKIINLDKELDKELKDLQQEIEEGNSLEKYINKGLSSILIPKDSKYFKNERKLAIHKALQIREAKALRFYSDIMQDEMNTCIQQEYTKDSLLLLLHQFFVDHVEDLTQCKYMHLLRWARFCEHTKEMEEVYPEYQNRIRQILTECEDSIERARRLSKCRESLISNTSTLISLVRNEDLVIYVRWLVGYFYSTRKINSFIKLVEWIPKSNFMFYKINPENRTSENKRYFLTVWSNQNEESEEKKAKMSNQGKQANNNVLPKFTSNIRDFADTLDSLLTDYGIKMRSSQVKNPSDEMDMFNLVLRKFKKLHYIQEQSRAFLTYDYDSDASIKKDDDVVQIYKKECNWLPFIKIKPDIDNARVAAFTKLKETDSVDHLLFVQSKMLHISSYDKVLFFLREHAKQVENLTDHAAIGKFRNNKNTTSIWTNIFAGSKQDKSDIMEFDVKISQEETTDNSQFDISSAVQKLGLEDDDSSKSHSFSGNGGLLSLCLLRHLKIKDLRQMCLHVLNYFRSVERTLTINDVGLSKNESTAEKSKQTLSLQGIGNHQYLHNTPIDYVRKSFAHMEDVDVENYDDFYSFKDNLVHVQDQKGWFVVYDAAIQDFKDIEEELLLVATHYVEYGRKSNNPYKTQSKMDLNLYSNRMIDRFSVLLDLWKCEASFQEAKQRLIDCYLEAYHHVTVRKERRKLAQIITNIIYKRPRFNFEESYFVEGFRLECKILEEEYQLIKCIINDHVTQQRHYLQRIHRDEKHRFGMPYKVIPIQKISINTSRPVLNDIYMLEFHPTLSVISTIPATIHKTFRELLHMYQPKDITNEKRLQLELLEIVHKHWNEQLVFGSSYSSQVRKEVFSDVFADDPIFIAGIGESMNALKNTRSSYQMKKEEMEKMVTSWCCLLELITYRHRLFESVQETDILSGIYINIARTLSIDECHAFLRSVSFEFVQKKTDQKRPLTFKQLQDDESRVDRFIPNYSCLAIAELDEKHLSLISFRNREGIVQSMQNPNALEKIRVALLTQICQKHILGSVVDQLHSCYNLMRKEKCNHPQVIEQSRISVANQISLLGVSSSYSQQSITQNAAYEKLQMAFVSLQAEKSFERDRMLNEFLRIKEKKQPQTVDEIVKIKLTLIQNYCNSIQQRIALHGTRAQILGYLYSLKVLFDNFPVTRDAHFMFGEYNESKKNVRDQLEEDPTQLKKRPRRFLSSDGSHVLNIWFIPHYTEVLTMFEELDDVECTQRLKLMLRIVASLHDICQCLCAHARTGSSHVRMGSHKFKFSGITADWGGTEGIGAELREIQKQVNQLPSPTDPVQVADFLEKKRNVIFLEFDITICHSIRNTFIQSGNERAHDYITRAMQSTLQDLSNVSRPLYLNTKMSIPKPLHLQHKKTQILFPWRHFLNKYSFCPFDFYDIAYLMESPLCGLTEIERHLVHGEILGMSLLLEDVLAAGVPQIPINGQELVSDRRPSLRPSSAVLRPKSSLARTTNSSQKLVSESDTKSSLNFITPCDMNKHAELKDLSWQKYPMKAAEVSLSFLTMWARLEKVKQKWGKWRLNLLSINSTKLYEQYSYVYNQEVLQVVYKTLLSTEDTNNEAASIDEDDLILEPPDSVTDYELKVRQLVKILENLECMMIDNCIRKLSREHTKVIAEKARDDHTLPTDIWRKSMVKGNITVPKPQLVEEFVNDLKVHKNDDNITFDRKHFEECLSKLASRVVNREKTTFLHYSSFYENLLRSQNQQLYMKEREVQCLKSEIEQQSTRTSVEIDCALAERSYALLVEITALRSRVIELEKSMTESNMILKQQFREKYNDVVLDLFQRAFNMKTRFDHFRVSLHDDVLQFVHDVRRSSTNKLKTIRTKYSEGSDTDNTSGRLIQAEKLREMEIENKALLTTISKLRTLNSWNRIKNKSKFEQQLGEYQRIANKATKESLEKDVSYEEKERLVKEEQDALRKMLISLDQECSTLRKKLHKEHKIQVQRSHAQLQEDQSIHHLEVAKSSNFDKLVSELEEKEQELKRLRENQSPEQRVSRQSSTETKRLRQALQQVSHERSLKLDAFDRVDELQRQINEMELKFTELLTKDNKDTFHETCFPIVPFGRVSPQKLRPISQGGLISLETPRPRTSASRRRPKSSSIKTTQRSKSVIEMLRPRISDTSILNQIER